MTIIKNIGKKIATYLSPIALLLLPNAIQADDIFKGVRGPTDLQLDIRGSYTERTDTKGNTTTTIGNNDVLKYWNGDKLGLFGFVNIPAYKSVNNGVSKSEGIGDLSLGLGPRGKLDLGKKGSINFLSYIGASLPTGDSKSKPALGNDRIDLKSGIYATFLTEKKDKEVDVSFDYTSAGDNSKGVKGLDEMSGGIVLGGKLTDNNLVRIALGGEFRGKKNIDGEWSYVYGPRAVLRITPPHQKIVHLDTFFDYDMGSHQDTKSHRLPMGYSLTTQLRINLGKGK